MSSVSNKTLALLLVTSIVVTLGVTVFTLNQLALPPITGKIGTTDQGRVNFTVQSSISISLTSASIDFGSGYVNSTKCPRNATLNAGASYNDTEGNDCWVDTTSSQPVSFNLQNDGNVNVLLRVIGPDQRAFLNYSGSLPNNLTWRARNNESNTCVPGASTFTTAYTDFGGSLKTVCSNMSYQPNTQDEIAVDIQVIIPADISPGLRTNSTVEFQASAVS